MQATLAQDRLKTTPGSMSVYCNDGFTLIEQIVLNVTGKSYARFVQDEIFTPLGMTLAPIFIIFILTHVILIGYGVLKHVPEIGAVTANVRSGFQGGLATLGLGGMILLFLATLLPIVGPFVIKPVFLFAGFGAVMTTRFGTVKAR